MDVGVLWELLVGESVEGGGDVYYSVGFFEEFVGGTGAGTGVRFEMGIVLLEEGVEKEGEVCHCWVVLCAASKFIRMVESFAERKHVTASFQGK